jgi:predicted nucleic acid-binding protein
MAAPAQSRRFALDSNILIDLGERKPFALAFLSAYQSSGLAVPPTVVQELTHLALDLSHPASKFAFEALSNMRQWDIFPYDLKSVGHGITELDAQTLTRKGLLPDEEFNDGLIIIETALACLPILVTSDKHLLGINQAQLIRELGELDLPPVNIVHPKVLLRATYPQ